MKSALIFCLLLALTAACSFGGTLSALNSPAGLSDSLDWSVLGSEYAAVPDGTSGVSVLGNQVTVNFAPGGSGHVFRQGSSWMGNFSPGTYLLYNGNFGPDTLTFSDPISAIVFQIQSDYMGDFSSQIRAYNGATLLGTFVVNGVSNGNADGSAVFLGVQDTEAEITSIIIDGLTAASNPQDFAISGLAMSSAAVPEPASVDLLGIGLVAAWLARRRSA